VVKVLRRLRQTTGVSQSSKKVVGARLLIKVVILRVCDFFEVPKNRCFKQNSYDDKIVKNLKKSQTLSEAKDLLLARSAVNGTPPPMFP
jgi:hypothetical protein